MWKDIAMELPAGMGVGADGLPVQFLFLTPI